MIVAKFGGSSLADARRIQNVVKIIKSNPSREYVIVSAPGKRNPNDQKITDLLYEWYRLEFLKLSSSQVQRLIKSRFEQIINDLEINFDSDSFFDEMSTRVKNGASKEYTISRGEYVMGKIMAIALGYSFIDPEIHLLIDHSSHDTKRDNALSSVLHGIRAVIPGFYGHSPLGHIKTFSRGGSDLTGAIVARAVRADVYENWTDVSGLLMADPNIVESPQTIAKIGYQEVRELSYMGARVFHEEAMFPVQELNIPTHILNTNNPLHAGTIISGGEWVRPHTISGIAGRKNFMEFRIEKKMMNQQIGFVRKILSILEEHKISFEHMPSSIDSLSIIIDKAKINGKIHAVHDEIVRISCPDRIVTSSDLALIAVVGQKMAHQPGVATRIFSSISSAGINIRMINQGSSEINIIIAVDSADFEMAVRAIYKEFMFR